MPEVILMYHGRPQYKFLYQLYILLILFLDEVSKCPNLPFLLLSELLLISFGRYNPLFHLLIQDKAILLLYRV